MKCWLIRWYLSKALDQGKDLPPWVNRHLAQCESCEMAHEALLRVHQSLSLQAAEMRQGIRGLPQRHTPQRHACPQPKPGKVPPGGFRFRLVLGSAGALATLILVALWQNPRTHSETLAGTALWSPSWKVPVEQAWLLPEKLENPLHQEMDQIRSTIGQAGRFLYDSIRIPLPGERGGS